MLRRTLLRLINHPGRVLAALAVVTIGLVAAGVATIPDKEASFDPSGEVFDTVELVERTFRASTTELLFIIEDEDADALDLETLREWKRNSEELRESDDLSPAFSTYFDSDLGRTVSGFYTVADAVDDELRASGVASGLEGATEDEVKITLSRVLDQVQQTVVFRDSLSIHATEEQQSLGGELDPVLRTVRVRRSGGVSDGGEPPFVVDGAEVGDRAVAPARVVPALDPLEDRRRQLGAGLPATAVEQLEL